MEQATVLLIAIAVSMFAGFVALAFYNWRQRKRVNLVQGWVRTYLFNRYGDLPHNLRLHCSADRLWPALVFFDDPRTGSRQRLRFACPGARSTLTLLSEAEEPETPFH
jgi:hypothetical protein